MYIRIACIYVYGSMSLIQTRGKARLMPHLPTPIPILLFFSFTLFRQKRNFFSVFFFSSAEQQQQQHNKKCLHTFNYALKIQRPKKRGIVSLSFFFTFFIHLNEYEIGRLPGCLVFSCRHHTINRK